MAGGAFLACEKRKFALPLPGLVPQGMKGEGEFDMPGELAWRDLLKLLFALCTFVRSTLGMLSSRRWCEGRFRGNMQDLELITLALGASCWCPSLFSSFTLGG